MTTRDDACGRAIKATLEEIRAAGTYKRERVIVTPQSSKIRVQGAEQAVVCFCANNYLGLCDNPELAAACKKFVDSHGFGMSSVRFICGTQDIHKELEKKITEFHRTQVCVPDGPPP
jgi:glycine C-acetyltransferase